LSRENIEGDRNTHEIGLSTPLDFPALRKSNGPAPNGGAMIESMRQVFRIEDDGTRTALTDEEHQALIDSGNQSELETLVALDDNGEEIQPYKFFSHEAPKFSDDGKTVII
jgi:hypothetical protein